MKYEYQCSHCQQNYEICHSMSEPAKTTCPECGNKTLKRLISGGYGFLLKGQGWYRDSYSYNSDKN